MKYKWRLSILMKNGERLRVFHTSGEASSKKMARHILSCNDSAFFIGESIDGDATLIRLSEIAAFDICLEGVVE